MKCPACNSKRNKVTKIVGVYECKKCGAFFGKCYKGESYEIVLPYMAKKEVSLEKQRYYDLICLGSDGITRRHGWFDTTTKLITQAG